MNFLASGYKAGRCWKKHWNLDFFLNAVFVPLCHKYQMVGNSLFSWQKQTSIREGRQDGVFLNLHRLQSVFKRVPLHELCSIHFVGDKEQKDYYYPDLILNKSSK